MPSPIRDTHMTAKLSDLHYVLLAIAAKRASGSILPPSTSIGVTRAGLTRAINSLIKHGFAEEVETTDSDGVWRKDGECQLAVRITDAGRAAVAKADGKKLGSEPLQPEPATPPPPEVVKPQTKQALLLAMLKRESGSTVAELVEATCWLPHTTRAALTGLRKKGYAIIKSKPDGVTRYTIVAAV